MTVNEILKLIPEQTFRDLAVETKVDTQVKKLSGEPTGEPTGARVPKGLSCLCNSASLQLAFNNHGYNIVIGSNPGLFL